MKHIFTSIDIGSDTIKIVVCELFNNKLNLLAASSVKSRGIKKGLIADAYEASACIKEGFNELEEMLGIKLKKVIATVPGYNTEYTMVKADTEIKSEDGIVNGDDIDKLLRKAIKNKKIPDTELVGVIPIDFTVDSKTGVKDPKGMKCASLSVRAIMVSTAKKNVYSVVGVLENLGLEVVDIAIGSIGDIYALKTRELEQQVGAIINIGHETTTVSLYNKGIVVKSSVLGYGSKNIENDLAYIYKLKPEYARKVKELFALAHKTYASKTDTYEVVDKTGENIKINQFEASEVVMSRIEEILVLARKEINILTKREVDYILISGGTSSMNNFSLIAEDVLGKIAKLGNIRIVGVRNNKYSVALGNIVYFIHKLRLKGQDYSMVSENDMDELSSTKKSLINNISNESMLGKVFGYFFNE